jgi:phospholipase/carboxylesterase
MLTTDKAVKIDNWMMRVHYPTGVGPFSIILMIHGWTGNEDSMWVFTSSLPKDALLIAPRGLYSTPSGGYSWYPKQNRPLPWFNDFLPAADQLFNVISPKNFPMGDFSGVHLLGFSQGAALACIMSILYPERISSLAGLSGFLPEGAASRLSPKRLEGLPVFMAHGTLDDRVPVDLARKSVAQLEQAGAHVTYCEDDVGHKLSAKCFRGLEAFYKQVNC